MTEPPGGPTTQTVTQAPSRVRVRRQVTARPARLAMVAEIDAQTGLGEALIGSLIRAQLRLALIVLGALAGTLGALPLVFRLAPVVTDARIAGIPLPWILLGFVAYPILLALGWYFVIHAERNEAAFIDALDEP